MTLSATELTKVNSSENYKQPAKIQDLAYGNILFEYYRGSPLKALNAILVAQKQDLLPNHKQSARLVSGEIYLELGMLQHAKQIFNQLLNQDDVKNELLNRLEFYLGKIQYRQGELGLAESSLEKIYNSLNQSLRDQSLIMLSNIAQSNQQKEKARKWLNLVSRQSELYLISRYNLGLSWLRDGDIYQATSLLGELTSNKNSIINDIDIKEESFGHELSRNIQDKANIALGFYHLTHKSYEQARHYLLAVRLDSINTNKALLGMGWSYLESGSIDKALTHWQELKSKDARDLAVQESMLAIPFAYQKASGKQQALDGFLDASLIYQKQIRLIDDLIELVEKGMLFEENVNEWLLTQSSQLNDDTLKDSKLLSKNVDYYLFELLSQHQFNQGFKRYQKLEVMRSMLSRWEQQLPMFDAMLQANEIRFNKKLPLVESYLADNSFTEFEEKVLQLNSDLREVEQGNKLHLLASQKELKIHNRIISLQSKINSLPSKMLTPAQRNKAARASAVLSWQLQEFKADKIWRLKKEIKLIERTLLQMNARKKPLANARVESQLRFNGYQEKVNQGASQVTTLMSAIKEQSRLQLNQLKAQVVSELNKRKQSLETYLLQADLAVARLHSQAVIIPELD